MKKKFTNFGNSSKLSAANMDMPMSKVDAVKYGAKKKKNKVPAKASNSFPGLSNFGKK